MRNAFDERWFSLDAGTQDLLILAAWLAPTVLALGLVTVRYRVWPLVGALLARHRGTAATAIVLIGLSVGLGAAVLAQERGLRAASARAADRFDLIVAAPGNEVTAMLAAVYLQSAALPLLGADVYADLSARPEVTRIAPLAFGDSVAGAPLVGTTAAFVTHLSGAPDTGRLFATSAEAVVGASLDIPIGAVLQPAHGHGAGADEEAHGDIDFTVVGRLARTGTPWDQAVVVPIESVWIAHGLGDGHAADDRGRIGPPYVPARMPGVPAYVVGAESLVAYYGLRSAFGTADRMAFFPGEVLTRLHGLLGNVRRVLSGMAIATEVLVAAAVTALLSVLLAGSARRFAMLRALGAPRGFVFAVAWVYGSTLVVLGALLGIGIGRAAAHVLARYLSEISAVAVRPLPAVADLSLVAAFALAGTALAMLPAWLVSGREARRDLRA